MERLEEEVSSLQVSGKTRRRSLISSGGVGRAEAARCGNGGNGTGGCASSSGGGTVDDKVGKDTRDARESSPQPGRKLRGGKVTGCRETGRKETGRKGTGGRQPE